MQLSDETRAEIATRAHQGESKEKLATEFNTTSRTVRRLAVLHDAGISTVKRKSPGRPRSKSGSGGRSGGKGNEARVVAKQDENGEDEDGEDDDDDEDASLGSAPSSSRSRLPTKAALLEAVKKYDGLLRERSASGQAKGAKDLAELDQQLWTTLSDRLQAKAATGITLTELKEIMRWKLARGTFRPTLPSLIASNNPEFVQATTLEAFTQYRDSSSKDDAAALRCLKTLCKLKGVGPATASLIMSLHDPRWEAFMSDECWACLPGTQGRKLSYSEADWKLFRKEVFAACENEWDADAAWFERACWAWVHQRGAGKSAGKSAQEGNAATTAATAAVAGPSQRKKKRVAR